MLVVSHGQISNQIAKAKSKCLVPRFKSYVSNLESNPKYFGFNLNYFASNQIANLQEKMKWWSSYLVIINTRSKKLELSKS
jgi:hypothetical protein